MWVLWGIWQAVLLGFFKLLLFFFLGNLEWFSELTWSASFYLWNTLDRLSRGARSWLLVQNCISLHYDVLLVQVVFKLGLSFLIDCPGLSLESRKYRSVSSEPVFVARSIVKQFQNLLLLAEQDTVGPWRVLNAYVVIFFADLECRSRREQKLAFLHSLQ